MTARFFLPTKTRGHFLMLRPIGLALRGPRLQKTLLISLLALAGCSGTPGKHASTLTATPNPVPAGKEAFGTSVITWNTGDGMEGTVYVSVGDKPEALFAGPKPQGSLDAPWIGSGAVYHFRLYAGKDKTNLLASVDVTRADK